MTPFELQPIEDPVLTYMELVDAGEMDGMGKVCQFRCGGCGFETDWIREPEDPWNHLCPECNSRRALRDRQKVTQLLKGRYIRC